MSRVVFAPERSKRQWIILLPVLLAPMALVVSDAFSPWLPRGIAVILLLLTIALAMIEGAFLVRVLPRSKAQEIQAFQLQAVNQVISKAGASLELQEVLDAITRLTVEVTGVRGCSIKLLDATDVSAKGGMRVRSLAGIRREVSELAIEAAENIYAKSLLDGRPVEVEGAQERDFPELDGEVESLVCVPLRHEGRVVGALCLYSEKGKRLPAETLSFLSRLGDLVAIFIENASVFERLKKVDEARAWFLLKASHELKSPLASIISICQTILDGYLGSVESKQREMMERIRFRAAVLLETANDLLALARTKSQTAGGPEESVELCGVLHETVKFFQAAAAEKDVTVEISTPCEPFSITTAREGTRSIMSNLISNAIKYSPAGSRVSVSLAREDEGARFTVSDRGIGIPETEQKGLFREFFRATNARSLTQAGTGLGLAIVKSLLDGMGGSIDVQSGEGKGTTVSVLFRTKV